MKTLIRITFSESADKAISILAPLGFKVDTKTWVQAVTMSSEDERYGMLVEELNKRRIFYHETRGLDFSSAELEQAELLSVIEGAMWGYPEPEDDYQKESYDPSTGCSKCGEGSKQIKPFSIRSRPNFGKNDIVAMFWTYELLVTEKLRKLVEDAGLTGAEFWPLFKYQKGGPSERVEGAYQLFVVNELPPMSKNTKFQIVKLPKQASPCSCGKLGRNLQGEQMRYRRKDLKDVMDFNKTYEWLGGGFGTTQWKVVSHRIYELFEKNKIRGVRFEPVVIED